MKTDKLTIEVIPTINNPWATAYYGPGEDDHVTVTNHQPEFYRDQSNENKCVADLLVCLYDLLLMKVDDIKILSPMCHLDNFTVDKFGEADPQWILEQSEIQLMEDCENLGQIICDTQKEIEEIHQEPEEAACKVDPFFIPNTGPQMEFF